jgi:hypothetical protein
MIRTDFRRALMTMQMEYVEMPELKLTLRQAGRLWAMPSDTCHAALSMLVATGFLVQTNDGSYLRRGTPPVNVDAIDPSVWNVCRAPAAASPA